MGNDEAGCHPDASEDTWDICPEEQHHTTLLFDEEGAGVVLVHLQEKRSDIVHFYVCERQGWTDEFVFLVAVDEVFYVLT